MLLRVPDRSGHSKSVSLILSEPDRKGPRIVVPHRKRHFWHNLPGGTGSETTVRLARLLNCGCRAVGEGMEIQIVGPNGGEEVGNGGLNALTD